MPLAVNVAIHLSDGAVGVDGVFRRDRSGSGITDGLRQAVVVFGATGLLALHDNPRKTVSLHEDIDAIDLRPHPDLFFESQFGDRQAVGAYEFKRAPLTNGLLFGV